MTTIIHETWIINSRNMKYYAATISQKRWLCDLNLIMDHEKTVTNRKQYALIPDSKPRFSRKNGIL